MAAPLHPTTTALRRAGSRQAILPARRISRIASVAQYAQHTVTVALFRRIK